MTVFSNDTANINLPPGETLRFYAKVNAAKVKNRALGRVGSYVGGSVRVSSSFSIHSGSSESRIVYGDNLLTAPGILFITDKRVILNSTQYGFELKHENISTIVPTISPKGFSLTAGAKTYLIVTRQAKEIINYLTEAADQQYNIAMQQSMQRQHQQLEKQQRQLEREERRILTENSRKQVCDFNQRNDDSLKCLDRAFRVFDLKFYTEERSRLNERRYNRKIFAADPPTREEITSELEDIANREITGLFFWDVNKKRQQYISDNIESVFAQRYHAWDVSRSQFEKEENEREEEFYKDLSDDITFMDHLLIGDQETVNEGIETRLEQLNLKYPYDLDLKAQTRDYVYVDLDLPEIEMIPHKKAVLNRNGEVELRFKSQKDIRYIYLQLVFGYALVISTAIFNAAPLMEEVVVSGYTQRRNSEGILQNEYVYSIAFERSKMTSVSNFNVDAYNYCTTMFKSVCYVQSNGLLKQIAPFSVGERHIGRSIAERAVKRLPSETAYLGVNKTQKAYKFCGECGNQIPVQANFCPQCGSPIKRNS